MSDDKDLIRTIEILQHLKILNTTDNNKNNTPQSDSKLGLWLGLIPTAIAVITAILLTGSSMQKWNESSERTKNEIRAEIAEKLSIQQEKFFTSYRDLSDIVKRAEDNNRVLLQTIEELEDDRDDMKDEITSLKRTTEDLYRTDQYLKSINNVKSVPPQ